MQEPLEEKPFRSSKINSDDQAAMSEILKVIVEYTNGEREESEDSFDNYSHQLRGRMLSNAPRFEERCLHGYETLIETLAEMDSEDRFV